MANQLNIRRLGYLTYSNYRYGLDARRSELTSMPGTMKRLVNCHVNQGAEIEKRKAFVPTTIPLPANTFGLEAGSSGLVTFGSIAAPTPDRKSTRLNSSH